MTDTDLDNLYKMNLPESHFAGLRGIFDAGVAYGQNSGPPTADISQVVPAATAAADDPVITTA